VGPPLSLQVPPTAPADVRGHDLYLPLPFADGCKITYETDAPLDPGAREGGEALYYQVNYRIYEPGTRVESISTAVLERARPVIERVQAELREGCPPWPLAGQPPVGSGLRRERLEPTVIEPVSTLELPLQGPAAIRRLALKLSADDRPQALRSLVLELECDGERTVWCPVEAFFGTGYLEGAVQTWFTRAEPGGAFVSAWVMPFERDATLRLRNLATSPVGIEVAVDVGPWEWDERSMHFHATWREFDRVETQTGDDGVNRGAFDLSYVGVKGKGVYVGDTLTIFNGASAWWGEGDEKIYLDGEERPSHIGTGTEDYYGYAWARPEPFSAPFIAQPLGAGNQAPGLTVNSRQRVLDAIPFRQSLRFDMELWHWAKTRVNFAPATFWYARPGARVNVAPDTAAAALPVVRERDDMIELVKVPGALEGEDLAVASRSGGTLETQDIPEFGWSEGRQLWWRDAAPGDRLELRFGSARAGLHRIYARLTKAPDYGVVRLEVNGRRAGQEFDRFNESVAHDELVLGVFTLVQGVNTLAVEIAGSSELAEPRHMFGLDYLRLETVEDQR
jgi:hypothetical protein